MTDADHDIRQHCDEIDRCNQRGGRMLSIVDLIEAGTMTPELAAYALAAIGNGASFMVGALPGGAGKTTVMGALLNLVPAGVQLVAADGMASIRRGAEQPLPRCCYVCHEISAGRYDAYLWGKTLRAYFALADAGHMLATNLHADTYEQARDQIRGDNGVSAACLRWMNLIFFLSVSRSGPRVRRRVGQVWESDGCGDHQPVFVSGSSPSGIRSTGLASAEAIALARETIDQLLVTDARTIEEVRAAILSMTETHSRLGVSK